MIKNRYIIACSGGGTRWENYLNTKKHLIKIGNEPLLDRTIRLINNYVSNGEICILLLKMNIGEITPSFVNQHY